jgi:membrane protein implicated in regulation of membrane protease activity
VSWALWVVAAVLLAAGELHTGGFYLAPFALGAAVAVVAALAGLGAVLQIVLFVAATAAVFAGLRPIARRHLITPPRIRTGTAALVGGEAFVVDPVDERSGSVRIGGETWTARAFLEGEAFAPGQKVRVMQIQGATALVAAE